MNAEVNLQVEGMTCTNCAMSVRRKLEKEGLENVDVNFVTGEVRFINNSTKSKVELANSIEELGYKVINASSIEKKNI